MLVTLFLLFPSCSDSENVTTDFGRMLEYVPASFLEEHDVWFGNPAYARQVYDVEDIDNVDALMALPEDEKSKAMKAVNAFLTPAFLNNHMQVAPLVGWDGFIIDRSMYHETPPPWTFTVSEGTFDEAVIGEKLLEQGYEEATYGNHTYYRKNDDMQIYMMSEISSWVLAKLNRVAVSGNVVITAPATDILTGILDAMSGDTESLEDIPSCLALSEEMGDVFYAVLIPRERIMKITATQTPYLFDLEAASGWEPLHEWETAALGWRDDGTDRFLVISLYYAEKSDAEADAANLVSRLNDYRFFTGGSEAQQEMGGPFTSAYEIGEPEISSYSDGATLTITCRKLPDVSMMAATLALLVEARDLLFLVPDPAPFLTD